MLAIGKRPRRVLSPANIAHAEAMPFPAPNELSLLESKSLLRQVAEFGDPLPHLILTGGDPLCRTDLYELIDYARSLGLEVSITPSATPALTEHALENLKAHGIQSLGLSLDGSNAERHDGIRAVPGCFERTITALNYQFKSILSITRYL